MFDKDISYESQYRLLVAKYGKPFATETKVLQNGFGARWNCRQTLWHLANGDTIVEFEDVTRRISPNGCCRFRRKGHHED